MNEETQSNIQGNQVDPAMLSHPPVVVLNSTVPHQKLEAIMALCDAVKNLSDALLSTMVTVTIKDCTFSDCQTAVSIEEA